MFPNLCNKQSQTNNLIRWTHYDETKKMAHDSHIVREKENIKLGPAKDKHQAPTHGLKLYVRAVSELEAWSTIEQLKRKP